MDLRRVIRYLRFDLISDWGKNHPVCRHETLANQQTGWKIMYINTNLYTEYISKSIACQDKN